MMPAHGGQRRQLAEQAGCAPDELLDFSANINPVGPPEWLRRVISRHVSELAYYPDQEATALVEAIAARHGLPREHLVVGNGSTEILHVLPRAIPATRAVIPIPSYRDYRDIAELAGWSLKPLVLGAENQFNLNWSELRGTLRGGEVVFLGQPNNPTGRLLSAADLERVITEFSATWFIVDESFADFVPNYRSLAEARYANLIVVKSLTKMFAIPGLRLGCAFATAPLAENLRRWLPPWTVNTLAQAVGVSAMHDVKFVAQSQTLAAQWREQLSHQLQRLGVFHVHPGAANFLFVEILSAASGAPLTAATLARRLLRERAIAIRTWPEDAAFAERFFRVAVRPPHENARLVAALAEILANPKSTIENNRPPPYPASGRRVALETSAGNGVPVDASISHFQGSPLCRTGHSLEASLQLAEGNNGGNAGVSAATGDPKPVPHFQGSPSKVENRKPAARHKPVLMLQGTGSSAGKSLLTAALGRILLQDGVRVAPFKAQNMSLNSFVTRDGGEMGRAQVVQAQACRLEPEVRMNPILLKPHSHVGAQVILRGRPIGHMSVQEYFQFKPTIFDTVAACFDSLAAEFDAVLIEGAGSPGEVNLQAHDIVNMRMARHAQAPVLLVGDIDRGGVFASFVGTMEVLGELERSLVAGFVVNKFRGDAALLAPALDYTYAHTGRRVLGVVPFIENLNLPEEDSHLWRQRNRAVAPDAEGQLDLAVIDLPHLSNFTDLDALRVEPDVCVRLVRAPEDLGVPDALILPGSKNTMADLACLRQGGLAAALVALQGRTEIVGICGGFQMLGATISDPHGVETADNAAADHATAGIAREPGGRTVAGLNLLPIHTVFAPDKTLRQTRARHLPSGCEVVGYEIHHGLTAGGSPSARDPFLISHKGDALGTADVDHRVWGTYLHGIFDADEFRRWFLDRLRRHRGLAPLGSTAARYNLEPELNRVAAIVRQHLDMNEIYRLMGL